MFLLNVEHKERTKQPLNPVVGRKAFEQGR